MMVTAMFISQRFLVSEEHKMSNHNIDYQPEGNDYQNNQNNIEYNLASGSNDMSDVRTIGKRLQAIGDEINSNKSGEHCHLQRILQTLFAVGCFSFIVFRCFRS